MALLPQEEGRPPGRVESQRAGKAIQCELEAAREDVTLLARAQARGSKNVRHNVVIYE